MNDDEPVEINHVVMQKIIEEFGLEVEFASFAIGFRHGVQWAIDTLRADLLAPPSSGADN